MDPNQMMNRSFGMWPPPPAAPPAPPPPSDDPTAAPAAAASFAPVFSGGGGGGNRGWKRRMNQPPPSLSAIAGGGGAGYHPPALGELQVQNRAKARRWFKNPNQNPNPHHHHQHHHRKFFPRSKAAAPRNTTSFIIRAKRAGGIASLVSPCPVTPAVLPTPRLSPSREGLVDMARAEWGVDGYGSMKGLIRLRRSPPHHIPNPNASDDDDDSSGSDVEEHVEVERRLDHDLSRFEMVAPGSLEDAGYVIEDDDEYNPDPHVLRLEEENLTLKEKLFLMEREMGDMRSRLEALEARLAVRDGIAGGDGHGGGGENVVREEAAAAMEEASENDGERGDAGSEKSGGEDGEESGRERPAVE